MKEIIPPTETAVRKGRWKRRLIRSVAITVPLLIILFAAGLWFSSNQLLFPVWRGVSKDLSVCNPETEKNWGKGCGNLRITHEFKFQELQIPALSGYQLPGWLIRTADNGKGPAKGAILLVHGGGGDRREETRFIGYYLDRQLDVLTFDLGGHGEAPGPVAGMTYGDRESRDVLSVYLYLTGQYDKVYAMGTSVGAASILIALPEMPKLAGVIAENPSPGFQRLIKESPVSKSIPGWFSTLLIRLTMLRGHFDGQLSPENSLRLVKTTPIFFIHSRTDKLLPYRTTEEMANAYAGPKTCWFPEKGDHAAIWEVDPADYEKRVTDFLNYSSLPATATPALAIQR